MLCLLGLTLGLLASCQKAGKEAAKTVMKKESKTVVMKQAQKQALKQTLKKSLKQSLRTVPKGRAALEVVPSAPGSSKFFPKINNLGRQAKNFVPAFNEQLLRERRKAVKLADQLPTVEKIKQMPLEKLDLAKGKDAGILRNNMQKVMGVEARNLENAFGGAEAHHIIAGEASLPEAQQARALLDKFGININHPCNGVFLPEDNQSIYKGFIHKGGHTPEYYKAIWNAVKNCQSKDELMSALNSIGQKMVKGDKAFALYHEAVVNL